MDKNNSNTFDNSFTVILGAAVLYITAIFILAWPAQLIWNTTVVEITRASSIKYLDMVRLMILIRILLPGQSSQPTTKGK